MSASKITCPKCNHSFAIEAAITGEIEDRMKNDFDTRLKQERREWEKRLETEREEANEKMLAQVEKLRKQAEKKAAEEVRLTMQTLQEDNEEKKKKLEDAQRKELALRKKQNELDERQRSLDLEIQQKMDDQRAAIHRKAAEQAADAHRLKDAEKEKQLADMKKQIDDLQRKAEQGSVQTQGEVLELELENQLRQTFPQDDITPVAKGRNGADITQTVRDRTGTALGTILWETKNTKDWGRDWIDKLKDDQRNCGAHVAIIVSEAMPREIARIGQRDGVWICQRDCAMGLATAMRAGILDVHAASAASQDREGKMERLYGYLSGIEFGQRVDAITEAFAAMQADLQKERRAMETLWSAREKQLQKVITSTARMYGDLQGIIGKQALPGVQALELPAGAS